MWQSVLFRSVIFNLDYEMDSLHFISNEEVLIPNVQPSNIKSAQANKSPISNKVSRDLQIKQGTLIMKKKKKKKKLERYWHLRMKLKTTLLKCFKRGVFRTKRYW